MAPVPLPWVTRDQARDLWPDAATIPDDTLDALLAAAGARASRYAAPSIGAPATDTAELAALRAQACTMLARDAWTAYRSDAGRIGFGTLAVSVRDLSPEAAALLRPDRGAPRVG